MGLTYISKNCEIYLGEDSAYREDMGSLPLDCIISAEEYNALPEEQKKEYAVLVPKSRGQGPVESVGRALPAIVGCARRTLPMHRLETPVPPKTI